MKTPEENKVSKKDLAKYTKSELIEIIIRLTFHTAPFQYITFEEAVSPLPDGDLVHTFTAGMSILIGADWSRDDILDKLRRSELIELTGAQAKALGHGMAAYNKDTKIGDILFIETNAERLAAFDTEVEHAEH